MSTLLPSRPSAAYSYSGADVSNAAWFEFTSSSGRPIGTPPVSLKSLSTISFAVHEAKSPVRSLGNKNVNGFTSSIRTIAGSMILSVIDRHPMAELIDEYIAIRGPDSYWGWSRDYERNGSGVFATRKFTKMLPSALAPFNMLFTAVPEVFTHVDKDEPDTFTYATCALFGIEIIEDSAIFSVNNILTEMSFTFVARDYAVFDQSQPLTSEDIKQQAAQLKAPTTEGVSPASVAALTAMKGGTTVSNYNIDPYNDVEENNRSSIVFSSQDTIHGRKLRWR